MTYQEVLPQYLPGQTGRKTKYSLSHLMNWTHKHCSIVRFQVLTGASIKRTTFWDNTPCSLVEVVVFCHLLAN
jgi:hypothetical protein